MNWWQAALLGLIQGLTEFLPVSSSGHLVLGQYVLGIDPAIAEGTTFEVFVHFGTVLSIITVYRLRIAQLIGGGFAALRRPGEFAGTYRTDADVRFIVYVALTLIPTGIVYIFFKDHLEALFGDPRAVCMALFVTGVLLLLTLVRKNPDGSLTWWKALAIGAAQAFAMVPGISRSGSTICTGLYLNVDPRKATDFSFIMLLPVVLGATLLKLGEVGNIGEQLVPLVIGTLVAFVSGVAAIKIMVDFVARGRLWVFAIYCFILGTVGLIYI